MGISWSPFGSSPGATTGLADLVGGEVGVLGPIRNCSADQDLHDSRLCGAIVDRHPQRHHHPDRHRLLPTQPPPHPHLTASSNQTSSNAHSAIPPAGLEVRTTIFDTVVLREFARRTDGNQCRGLCRGIHDTVRGPGRGVPDRSTQAVVSLVRKAIHPGSRSDLSVKQARRIRDGGR